MAVRVIEPLTDLVNGRVVGMPVTDLDIVTDTV